MKLKLMFLSILLACARENNSSHNMGTKQAACIDAEMPWNSDLNGTFEHRIKHLREPIYDFQDGYFTRTDFITVTEEGYIVLEQHKGRAHLQKDALIKLHFIETSNPVNPPKDMVLRLNKDYKKRSEMNWMGWSKVGYLDDLNEFHENQIDEI